jgi:hypothetical protein
VGHKAEWAGGLLTNLKRKIGWIALWAGPNTEKQYKNYFEFFGS